MSILSALVQIISFEKNWRWHQKYMIIINYLTETCNCLRILRTTMATPSKNGRMKSKINSITKTQMMSLGFILIIDWWNNEVKLRQWIFWLESDQWNGYGGNTL